MIGVRIGLRFRVRVRVTVGLGLGLRLGIQVRGRDRGLSRVRVRAPLRCTLLPRSCQEQKMIGEQTGEAEPAIGAGDVEVRRSVGYTRYLHRNLPSSHV